MLTDFIYKNKIITVQYEDYCIKWKVFRFVHGMGKVHYLPPPPQLFHFTRGDNIEMKNRCSLMERILKMLLLNQFVDHCIDYRVLKQHANDDSISS